MSIGLYDSVLYALCVLYLLISLSLPLLTALYSVSAKKRVICRASNSRNLWVIPWGGKHGCNLLVETREKSDGCEASIYFF